MASVSQFGELRDLYCLEMQRIRSVFDNDGDGMAVVRSRSNLVDRIVLECGSELIAAGGTIAALGGYGRQTLFPYSDIDLLFLCPNENSKHKLKNLIRKTSQDLWDLRLKLSPTTRTLAECDRVDLDNIEFNISLLDARFLGGDQELFNRLRHEVLPSLVRREWQSLLQLLVDRTQTRHEKYGKTIFHLEPNIKEAPGGLRDYNVSCWLSLLEKVEAGEKDLPAASLNDGALPQALEFLYATRTFLHYRAGRDDNTLSWDAQDQAASRSVGVSSRSGMAAPAWMRLYFRHARAIDRTTASLIQEIPGKRSSLYRQFQRWRSKTSSPDFSVIDGRVYLQEAQKASNPDVALRAFEFIAANGFEFSSDMEAQLSRAMQQDPMNLPERKMLGQSLANILKAPHAARSLRTMHAMGFLARLSPEFQLIDSLVIRDFYHRYTVDEHTFTAIDNLHRLPSRENEWDKRFAELLQEVEHPETLYLSLLFHDLGKGIPSREHTNASVELARASLERLAIESDTAETVLFLIANHLEMSSAMRRDIFDPDNVRALALKVGTLEKLRLLCLMTYADIRAVNPEALTPWKAENLWRLFAATSNQLNRGVDDDLIHVTAHNDQVQRLQALLPNRPKQLQAFLEGLPRRYLLSHTSDQVAVHFDLSLRLGHEPVAIALKLGQDLHELSVVTTDRPFIFARIAGALAAWGMNIVRANAFSNAAGVVVDSFHFKDRFKTLELNPPERDRFKRSIADVVAEKAELKELMQRRGSPPTNSASKVAVNERVSLDNDSSSHSTLLEVVTADKPGLLYDIASAISQQGCNIELALIDTEGQTAIDVFYVTRNRKKISVARERGFRKAIQEAIS